MKATIESTRFGALEVDNDKMLTFPNGLIGFENCKRFAILHEDHGAPGRSGDGQKRELREEKHIVHYLQSLDDPDLSLPVVDPVMFGFNYDMTLTTEDLDALRVKGGDYVAVLLIVSKYPADRYREDLAICQNISANISGPIVINTRSRIGMQKVLEGLTYNVTIQERQKLGTVSAPARI